MKRAGGRGGPVDGSRLAACRMYDGWPALRDGYAKSLWGAVGGSPAASAAAAAALTAVWVLPAARGAARVARRAGRLRRRGGRPGRGRRGAPAAGCGPTRWPTRCRCWLLDVLMARSVVGHRRGTLTWRGRPRGARRRAGRRRPATMGAVTDPDRPPACASTPTEMETRAFYRVLNSVVVPRPIAWVCSRSADGVLNLAPHSFYTVACVDPPVVQFTSVGRKDSLRNVEATGEFTVSLTPEALFEQVNATGTDFPPGTSEAEHVRRPAGAQRRRRRPPGRRVAGRRRVHAALHAAAGRQHRRLRPGACRSASWESAVRDGRPRIEHLRPLARLGGNEWSTIGEVKEIRADPLPRRGRRTPSIGGATLRSGRAGRLRRTSGRAGARRPRRRRRRRTRRRSGRGSSPAAGRTPGCRSTSTAAVATAEPSWVARSRPRPHMRPAMKPARSASPPPVGSTGLVSGTAMTEIGSAPACRTRTPSAARVVTQVPTRASTSSAFQPVFCWSRCGLVLVGEQQVGAVDQAADHLAVGPGQLLAGVGGERGSRARRHSSVCRTIAVGSLGPTTTRSRAPDPRRHRAELDAARPPTSRPSRTTRSGCSPRRWCRRSGRCA